MASAISNFKERDLGGIVDELFRVYLRNFLPFLGIIAVAGIPLAMIGTAVGWYALSYPLLNGAELTILLFLIVALVVASILAHLLMSAAVTYAVAGYYQGNRLAIRQAYQFAWHRLGSLVAATLLVGLAVLAMSITIIGIPAAICFGVT